MGVLHCLVPFILAPSHAYSLQEETVTYGPCVSSGQSVSLRKLLGGRGLLMSAGSSEPSDTEFLITRKDSPL